MLRPNIRAPGYSIDLAYWGRCLRITPTLPIRLLTAAARGGLGSPTDHRNPEGPSFICRTVTLPLTFRCIQITEVETYTVKIVWWLHADDICKRRCNRGGVYGLDSGLRLYPWPPEDDGDGAIMAIRPAMAH